MRPLLTMARSLTNPKETPMGQAQQARTISVPYFAGEVTMAAPPRYLSHREGIQVGRQIMMRANQVSGLLVTLLKFRHCSLVFISAFDKSESHFAMFIKDFCSVCRMTSTKAADSIP